jgi:hypothetical protein
VFSHCIAQLLLRLAHQGFLVNRDAWSAYRTLHRERHEDAAGIILAQDQWHTPPGGDLGGQKKSSRIIDGLIQSYVAAEQGLHTFPSQAQMVSQDFPLLQAPIPLDGAPRAMLPTAGQRQSDQSPHILEQVHKLRKQVEVCQLGLSDLDVAIATEGFLEDAPDQSSTRKTHVGIEHPLEPVLDGRQFAQGAADIEASDPGVHGVGWLWLRQVDLRRSLIGTAIKPQLLSRLEKPLEEAEVSRHLLKAEVLKASFHNADMTTEGHRRQHGLRWHRLSRRCGLALWCVRRSMGALLVDHQPLRPHIEVQAWWISLDHLRH